MITKQDKNIDKDKDNQKDNHNYKDEKSKGENNQKDEENLKDKDNHKDEDNHKDKDNRKRHKDEDKDNHKRQVHMQRQRRRRKTDHHKTITRQDTQNQTIHLRARACVCGANQLFFFNLFFFNCFHEGHCADIMHVTFTWGRRHQYIHPRQDNNNGKARQDKTRQYQTTQPNATRLH
jgi:hypothetical protein